MAEMDRNENDRDNLLNGETSGDRASDDEGLDAGTPLAGLTGTGSGAVVVPTLDEGFIGGDAMEDLVDDGDSYAEPDHESSADSFAGGDSSGGDTRLSGRDEPR